MECYEGATMIKTFRGLLVDDTQQTIVLHTNNGSLGYKIVKFQVLGIDANTAYENVVQIWSQEQTTITALIDLSNQQVLAAGLLQQTASTQNSGWDAIIFDRMIFNQDIYISQKGPWSPSASVNWYLELEQFKLDLSENTVATMKDIRNKGVRTLTT